MAKSMWEKYEAARDRIEREDALSDEETQRILEFLDANDPSRSIYSMPDGETKSDGTLARYASTLRRVAVDMEPALTDATAYDINQLMDAYLTGTVEGTKDGGVSKGTVRNRQGPLRRFYWYHDDLGITRDEIPLADRDDSPVDERDMFTTEEVHSLREEASRRGTRDACLVDLLLYTGQRRSAILNLRLKDVNPEEGVFYLNLDDGDLKGASGKRPLLGAQKAVRDWKRQHPTKKPDDYLITHKHDQSNRDSVTAGDKLDPSTVYRQLQRIGNAVGVEKPVNAKNFRHYFVTVCKRDYGMDNDTIRHLIGHEPDSKVMERTYAHLTDDDHIKAAEEKYGIREPADESPLTPPVCTQCSEPLEGEWKSCPYCGFVYAPDAQEAQAQVNADLKQSYAMTNPEAAELLNAVDGTDAAASAAATKPAAMDALIEKVDALERRLETKD